MKLVWFDVEGLHILIRYFYLEWILPFVQPGFDFQSCLGHGSSYQFHNDFMAHQRSPSPVHADVRKQTPQNSGWTLSDSKGARDSAVRSSIGFRNLQKRIKTICGEAGRNTLKTDLQVASAQHVTLTEDTLAVELTDGRTVSVPLAWYSRLLHGTLEERNNWRLIGQGEGVHWPDLDEDISVENLLLARPSGESQRSFEQWLKERAARRQ